MFLSNGVLIICLWKNLNLESGVGDMPDDENLKVVR